MVTSDSLNEIEINNKLLDARRLPQVVRICALAIIFIAKASVSTSTGTFFMKLLKYHNNVPPSATLTPYLPQKRTNRHRDDKYRSKEKKPTKIGIYANTQLSAVSSFFVITLF